MLRPLKAIAVGLAAWLAFAFMSPLPAAALDPDSGSFKIRFTPTDIYPPVSITDLTGTAGGIAGQALLEWTAPQENEGLTPSGTPVSSYDLRTATFSIADVGGSTTAWFAAASSMTTPTPTAPSTLQASLTSLEVATTYYFAIRSRDDAGLDSDLDTRALTVVNQTTVGVRGIQGVTDLTALTGSGSGEIDLAWTAPAIIGPIAPIFYDFRVSSQTNILDDAEFTLAAPLSAVSDSTAPAGASPGFAHTFTVTGLTPAVTYYFAVRETDSGVPYFGAWRSSAALGINDFNSARASFVSQPPESVTNLTALPGTLAGGIALAWTAPANLNGVAIDRYEIKFNTSSIFDVGGSTAAWFSLDNSTDLVIVDASPPGTDLSIERGGLNSSLQYFFGIRSVDITGQRSDLDTGALSVAQQARAYPRPTPPIINLTAVPGALSGAIDLEWTIPSAQGLIDPRGYEIRASSQANINNDLEFEAAQPLSAFTESSPPIGGTPGTTQTLALTGLKPRATYYFAMRVSDSNTPPVQSVWTRDLGQNINVNNFAAAHFISNPPEAVTDLTALSGTGRGEVALSWTAPLNQNFVAISSYVIYAATFPVTDFPGNTPAWEAVASSRVYYPAALPGAVESFVYTGLQAGEEFFFSLRSVDEAGDVSPADTDTQNAFNQNRASAQGVGDVRDLNAQGGTPAGSIDLSWTTPKVVAVTAPFFYDIRASTAGNITDDAGFAAAQPLSAFTGSPVPAYLSPGAPAGLQITGLAPFTTFYFAIRVVDSSATPNTNEWSRNQVLGINTTNFSAATFVPRPPVPITDLTALTGVTEGRVELSWTAPENPNFVPVSSYTVAFATFSIAGLAGDATAWFTLASSQVVVAPAQAPGSLESLSITGLEPGRQYFFAVRSIDEADFVSPVDDSAAPDKLNSQIRARAYGIERITDLTAATGAGSGQIALSWTTPHRAGALDPSAYVIKASSISNIEDAAGFAAAQSLSALSSSVIPAVGAGGVAESLTVTGLLPFATYYFAIRVEDSSAPVANTGVWLRETALGRNAANFASGSFFANPPDPITDLVAVQIAPTEGRIQLSWTAPRNRNFIPIANYSIRFTTVPVTAAPFLGDTTAWFNAASASDTIVSPAQGPGALETAIVEGLHPANTVYFTIRAIDAIGEIGSFDSKTLALTQASTRPFNAAPATPSALTAVEGTLQVNVGWAELPDGLGGKGFDFSVYRLERSTDDANFVSITTGSAAFYRDIPLKAFATYYYRVSAIDEAGLESAPSASIAAVPVTLLPMEPFGIFFERNGSSITMSWAETTRFNDETAFINSPVTIDELSGYRVERSTTECSAFSPVATLPVGSTSYTEIDMGTAYFYRIASFNQYFQSTSPIVLASLGDQIAFTGDCVSRVTLPEDMQNLLLDPSGDPEKNIRIKRETRFSENGGKVINTVDFLPMRGGTELIPNFTLPRPIEIRLRYDATPQGAPVPVAGLSVNGGAGLQTKGAQTAANAGYAPASGLSVAGLTPAAAGAEKNLGVFWNNGKEYKKQYGTINTANQTISVMTPNLGSFQVRTQLREQGVTFDLSNITTRIITPNNDGRNDVTIMLFDNPAGASVEGVVYDLRGAKVADMTPGPQPNTLMWDGRMNGSVVTSGVYVYQVKGDGKTFNGTFVVAR